MRELVRGLVIDFIYRLVGWVCWEIGLYPPGELQLGGGQGSRTWRTFSDPELTQNHFLRKRRLRKRESKREKERERNRAREREREREIEQERGREKEKESQRKRARERERERERKREK